MITTVGGAAILVEGTPTSNFAYLGTIAEIVLLGTIACPCSGQNLHWDSAKLQFANSL